MTNLANFAKLYIIPLYQQIWWQQDLVKMLRYPAADRNKDAILEVFKIILTNDGKLQKHLKALEIGFYWHNIWDNYLI